VVSFVFKGVCQGVREGMLPGVAVAGGEAHEAVG